MAPAVFFGGTTYFATNPYFSMYKSKCIYKTKNKQKQRRESCREIILESVLAAVAVACRQRVHLWQLVPRVSPRETLGTKLHLWVTRASDEKRSDPAGWTRLAVSPFDSALATTPPAPVLQNGSVLVGYLCLCGERWLLKKGYGLSVEPK